MHYKIHDSMWKLDELPEDWGFNPSSSLLLHPGGIGGNPLTSFCN